MLRLLLLLSALVACTPSPRKAAMPTPDPMTADAVPVPDAAALGRRTLSTAFVRIGPDGHLTVERHDGHALVLRDVRMGPRKYCGVGLSGARYCGDYAEVAAARPGGAPLSPAPDRSEGNPVAPGRDPANR